MSIGKVRLYRTNESQNIAALAVADPKDTFAILSDEMVEAKAKYLIAEAEPDVEGNFTFELGANQNYKGEAFDIDFVCGTVPHRPPFPHPPKPLQFSITTIQPRWRQTSKELAIQTEQVFIAAWEYCIPSRYWCAVRARFGAWTICGQVTTCNTKRPVPNVRVFAFDTDIFEDDSLGSAVTDASGKFRIDYTTEDFQKTPFSPLINFEIFSGPDLYFRIETLGGALLLAEDRLRGRQPDRGNVGNCFCVDLCVQPGQIVPTPEQTPHWLRVEGFKVHPSTSDPASNFLPEGYAGLPENSFTFGGNIALYGNCPRKNIAPPNNPLKYRFRIAEWSWVGGGDGDAGILPTIPPPPPPPAPSAQWQVVKVGGRTWVGDVIYDDGVNPFAYAPVYITTADQDAEGWIKLEGKAVTVPLAGGGTRTEFVSDTTFIRSGLLMSMDSMAVSNAHSSRRPAWASDATQAGRSLLPTEQEPIRRYRMIFEVHEEMGAVVFTDSLDSIVIDNSAPVVLLNLEELLMSACNPLAGLTDIHVRYTVDHPHLRYFTVEISNNTGTFHAAPPAPPAPAPVPPPPVDMPRGDFFPPLNYLFRGGASGPNPPSGAGGYAVNIASDPKCAYRVKLKWLTRRLYTSVQSTEILYCK
ncbi:MAG TPA: hypothetical protein V6D26_26065 [Stenomitos sp.]